MQFRERLFKVADVVGKKNKDKLVESRKMTIAESFLDGSDYHPIDLVESLATRHEWHFARHDDNQIDLTLEGNWRIYVISMAWSGSEDMLKLVCCFDLGTTSERMPGILDTINRANDLCWTGAFTYSLELKQMVYRYGLVLGDEATLSTGQVERLLSSAYSLCERFYPAFQLVAFGDHTPEEAMHLAIAETYGHA